MPDMHEKTEFKAFLNKLSPLYENAFVTIITQFPKKIPHAV